MTNIKNIILNAGFSLTEVAHHMSVNKGLPYTVQSLSNKIRRGSLRYNEALEIFAIIGYEIKLVKKKEQDTP